MEPTTQFQLRPILIRWEKLRIVYNVVLAIVVVAMLIVESSPVHDRRFLIFLVQGVIGANICFTAGPAVEAYVSYLANRRLPLTWLLFVPGMLFAILLTVASVLTFSWPD